MVNIIIFWELIAKNLNLQKNIMYYLKGCTLNIYSRAVLFAAILALLKTVDIIRFGRPPSM